MQGMQAVTMAILQYFIYLLLSEANLAIRQVCGTVVTDGLRQMVRPRHYLKWAIIKTYISEI